MNRSEMNALESYPQGIPWSQALAALTIIGLCTWLFYPSKGNISAPLIGCCWPWKPKFLAGIRFATGAQDIISEGYTKCKDSSFRISRTDGDVLVLSRKYLDELHNAPVKRLSSMQGLIKNFGGYYSGIHLLGESDVGTHALQTKITPNLPKLSDDMRDEVDYALKMDMPSCHVTMTQMAMRFVPPWMRPLLDLILPSSRKYKASVRDGKKMMIPEIERRRHLEETDPDYVKPDDLLQAMMDLSSPGEKQSQPEDLAHRQLLVTVVAGHSTAAAASHALFDMAARPECLDELRGEAVEVLRDEGGYWGKQSLGKLAKMDSFLRESQRMNPPSLLGFHRIVQDPSGITLNDGLHIPYGTHIAIAPHSVSSDPTIINQPETFNALRYFERRRENTTEATRHQHVTADKDHLHFGYGTWSCPGRFLASAELKMVLVELLLRYDFRYPEGSSRPVNRNIEEFPYVDVETPLLVRRRR
ncbi:hypothetical protein CDD80_6200 [Ophiocordyceps camponoti-rufipedis]|uniref:Cytochrome P450 n=1 Tax=Ophiocordyceps camponoti-rufipedis TaxID=2004952 RepID=A0A2C5XT33_9HYPO|nr:hypothetical protein CDD80_6200 [Ophiocordyceps camponoti-rufipedis]